MLSAIPVALVALPMAVGMGLATSKFLRFAAFGALVVREMTRRYPTGEGPLSIKRRVTITPGPDLGGLVFNLAQVYPELKVFENTRFTMTMTELRSFGFLLESAASNSAGVPALVDYMERFPRKELIHP